MAIGPAPHDRALTRSARFWRNRVFARIRHELTVLRRCASLVTRSHAALVRLSGGRIRRSFIFTGGMPILILTTIGRKSGKRRSIPLGYIRYGNGFAVLASNAGNDRVPAWWLNLEARRFGEVLADGRRRRVSARLAEPTEDEALWKVFASLNPGFDEYRRLTDRRIPVVLLTPVDSADRVS